MFYLIGEYYVTAMLKLKVIFLIESLAACDTSTPDLVMYFTVNMAFINYFDSLIDSLDAPILQKWTCQEQILPISLQSFEFKSSLLQVPKH